MKVVSNPQPLNVLFLCTGNSARSIMAEVILNRLGRGKFRAFSAGSQPAGQVNPMALNVLRLAHYDVSGLRSKPWGSSPRPAQQSSTSSSLSATTQLKKCARSGPANR